MKHTKTAVSHLEALYDLFHMIAYSGFGGTESGNDIDGVVTIPTGTSEGLEVKDWCVWCKLQDLKTEIDRLDNRTQKRVRNLTNRYYRDLCRRSEGKRFCKEDDCGYR